jgi:hypothetical protein
VDISATPEDCYVFLHWVDAEENIISDENPYSLTIVSDTLLVAIFERETFELEVMHTDGGSVASPDVIFECGMTYNISATPDAGYDFVHWIDASENIVSTDNPLAVTIVSDTTLVAVFEEQNPDDTYFTLTIIAGEGGTTNPTGTSTIKEGTEVTITAIPDDRYTFVNWAYSDVPEDVWFDNPLEITLTKDMNLVAHFENKPVTLTTNTIGKGSISYPDGDLTCGQTINLAAVPDDKWEFICWTNASGDTLSKEDILVVLIVSDTIINAHFEEEDAILEHYLIDINITPNPATDLATLTMDVETACNMKVILCDQLGSEFMEIHNGFADMGLFTSPIDTRSLPSGTYFLKILVDGKFVVKKFIVN